MLLAMLRRMGCAAADLGAVRDDPELIRRKLVEGLNHDVLLVSGGMSMGRHDHVPRVANAAVHPQGMRLLRPVADHREVGR